MCACVCVCACVCARVCVRARGVGGNWQMVRWEDLVRVWEIEIMFTLGGEVGEQRRSGVYPGGKKVNTEGKTGPFWEEAS